MAASDRYGVVESREDSTRWIPIRTEEYGGCLVSVTSVVFCVESVLAGPPGQHVWHAGPAIDRRIDG